MALKSVNIDRLTLKPRNRVAAVGVELEGGWTTIPTGLRREDFIRDGSLDPLQRAHPHAFVMELPSPPLEENAMAHWMRANWPQLVDSTCGMHVHVSFKASLTYARVVKEEYPGTIVEYMKKWAEKEGIPADNPIWPRLRGESQYCQHQFFGDDQIRNTRKDHDKVRRGHRYTVVNFCWGRGIPTAECRLLPMFADAEQGIRAMREVVSITNRFLAATAKKERKLKSGFVIDPNDMVRVERRIVGV
jgi:hypothetical protein